ncbi:flagellin [Devosia sp.]|uniref:flagellin N-terminal helical domain-containing protein n=1 Tax=Devosia sp. TaxID=1871048 RepID=UPI0025F61539|nr:flagellin [Devosia sp.]MCR6634434.1 flagellin [Devosia sp.]
MSINLSSNARTGLTVLRNVAEQMATTQSRLVTGKAVNSPLDNVSKFFTASSMDTRAASIDALMDNINAAQSSMKAASEGIKGIQGLIKEARGLTSQALTSSAANAKVTGSATVTGSTAITAADTVVLTTTSGTYTYTAPGGGGTVQGLIDGINADADVGVTAALVDGKLTLTGSNNEDITIAGTGTGLTAPGLTAGTTAPANNATREALSKQFEALRSEIDRIAKDAGINGTNLLDGDKIQLALNEDGSSSTTIKGTSVNSSSLNIDASTNTWQSDADINATLTDLIGAADSLEATAASFSSNQSIINARKDFNSSLSDILKSSASNLTAADMDQEAANLVALQTRQQMATTALSIMQSSETTALRLLS